MDRKKRPIHRRALFFYANLAKFLVKRDFFLAAAFLWMMPLAAALSNALTALSRRAGAFAGSCSSAASYLLIVVRKLDLADMLRSRLVRFTRILFSADLLVANGTHLLRQIYSVIISLETGKFKGVCRPLHNSNFLGYSKYDWRRAHAQRRPFRSAL